MCLSFAVNYLSTTWLQGVSYGVTRIVEVQGSSYIRTPLRRGQA